MSPKRAAGGPSRRPRGSLSEQAILDAAIEIIERDGVDGLSMPILARHLGAGVMSIYWYFKSKDDLLGALADRALLDVYAQLPPMGGGSWDDETIAQGTALHRRLRQSALYLELCRTRPQSLVSRPKVIPVLAERLEASLNLLDGTTPSPSEAVRFMAVLDAYIRGFAMMQVGAQEGSDGQSVEQALRATVKQLNPDKFPTLRAVSDIGAVVSLSDDHFDDGLRLLVEGMKAELV